MMNTFFQDLRFSVRQLLKHPAFAAVAILTLGIGIGANTAIFSVVNSVLLRPLPFPESDRLVQVVRPLPSGMSIAMSPPDFLDYQRENRTLEDLAAFDTEGYTLTGDGEPLRVGGAAVSASFFDVLKISPTIGRPFLEGENEPGQDLLVVLGHGLWERRFGGDPGVLGRRIEVNEVSRTVVGVMPADFRFGEWDLLTPLVYDEGFRNSRGAIFLQLIGRLAPGVAIEQASADLARVAADLEAQYPESNTGRAAALMPLKEQLTGAMRPGLLILLGAVGLVLLIACVNVANLLLARGAAREGEMAIRAALGAGRGRLVRQLLTESLMMGVAGGLLGLFLAFWGTELLIAMQPPNVPRLDSAPLDGTVIAFTAGAALLTSFLFGLAPAMQATRPNLVASMKRGGRSTRAPGRSRLRSGLVVAEVGLAIMLLTGAGLLIKSFSELQRVDPGFQPESTLAFALSLPEARYPEDPQVDEFFAAFMERIEAIPGVRSAGAIAGGVPMSGSSFVIGFEVEGREPLPLGQSQSLNTRVVTPDYFRTLGIPVITGRGFVPQDRADAPQVVVLNQAAVREFFPDEDPIGQRIVMGWTRDGNPVGGEVVGLVGDVRQTGLGDAFIPEIYIPHAQVPTGAMTVVVRAAADPLDLVGIVRAELMALDPNLPISNVRTMEDVLATSVAEPRFYMMLLTVFAAVALLLAAIGIFGVMSYSVTQRTGEIGIRLALGAAPGDVLTLVVGQGAGLIAAGTGLGVLGAFGTTRLLSSLLFGVGATDPAIFTLVPALLMAVALLSCYIPARRATKVDPLVALRAE
jgi:putative ABC transport system permease protein